MARTGDGGRQRRSDHLREKGLGSIKYAGWRGLSLSLSPFPRLRKLLRLTLIKPHNLHGRIMTIRVSEKSDDFSGRALQ
jgi:hypothetical protein